MTRSLLADAYGHHVWATLTLAGRLPDLDDKQLATDVPGTYGSILAIARHMVGADYGYLYALTGGTYPEIDEDTMSMADLRAAMERNGAGLDRAAGTGARPGHRRRPAPRRQHVSHAPMGIRLAQVVHHGTDHRSQICTALTTIGDHAARDRCLGLRLEGPADLGGGDARLTWRRPATSAADRCLSRPDRRHVSWRSCQPCCLMVAMRAPDRPDCFEYCELGPGYRRTRAHLRRRPVAPDRPARSRGLGDRAGTNGRGGERRRRGAFLRSPGWGLRHRPRTAAQ